MSFASDARAVRDPAKPVHLRVTAWRRCLRRYAPYGVGTTLRHLRERFGSLDDPAALESAMSALEASRRVWLAEVARFQQGRRAAKAQGRRRARPVDLAPYRDQGWPGGVAAGGPRPGSLTDQRVTDEFLARYGMTLWTPQPVDHRRRLRRLSPIDSATATFFGSVGCGGCLLGVIALVAGLCADPPAIAWWSFATAGVLTLLVVAWREVASGADQRRSERADRARVVASAEAAERRCRTDRMRSFNI
ncbi:hypothetical protein O7623_06985 [Solwaraspora sp. WMMD791]|uniref:hypothetical protein n=1 Tax=Solwaraspora sp. WMMD791 TaxID=3016086 RepID=UPI00249B2B0B|nr:hypothetical protein [Solwaraspora sp. WMMD791]WFE28923.1 hypothetical protein O7623_06985 [Solwaraspora sp. WMMD791]